jgi:hypothetical protein
MKALRYAETVRTMKHIRLWSALLSAVAAASAMAAVFLVPAGAGALAAATKYDIAGKWSCCGTGGAGAQDFVITSGTGALAGTDTYPSGGVFAKISGTLTGSTVKIVTTYTGSSYVATFSGTIAAGGNTMSGHWAAGKAGGTWTAARISGPATSPPSTAPVPQIVVATTISVSGANIYIKRFATGQLVPLRAGTVAYLHDIIAAGPGVEAVLHLPSPSNVPAGTVDLLDFYKQLAAVAPSASSVVREFFIAPGAIQKFHTLNVSRTGAQIDIVLTP